jgi:hypothetical protein
MRLRSKIYDFFDSAEHDDFLLFYFSGHTAGKIIRPAFFLTTIEPIRRNCR